MTNRISCVAYAVDEIASEEKTASAIVFDDALVLLLGGGQRPADEQPFQRVEHDALRLRGRPLVPARSAQAGRGRRSACHFDAIRPGFGVTNPSPCGNLTAPRCASERARAVASRSSSQGAGGRGARRRHRLRPGGQRAGRRPRAGGPHASRSSTRTPARSGACRPDFARHARSSASASTATTSTRPASTRPERSRR